MSGLPFELVEIAALEAPTAIAVVGDVWITTQDGRLWRVPSANVTPGSRRPGPTLALDLRPKIAAGGELGLLGLAFAPTFPEDPRIFVNYTYKVGPQIRTRIASFVVGRGVADPKSEVEILSFDQPWANHNSGSLAFGPDGMLYIGVGDGGSGGDPRGTGQNPADWLGSILRVDVSTVPYHVPADNPHIPGAAPEVYCYGMRNIWGMHFDGSRLYFADVGQDEWEEVDIAVSGGNYGWNVREGNHCYNTGSCPDTFVRPLAEFSHNEGQSVTGGVVYRGPSIPAFDGLYLYADFYSGKIWGVPPIGGEGKVVVDTGIMLSTFATDALGRLYLGDYRGHVWRVDPPGAGASLDEQFRPGVPTYRK